ncbi:CbiX/SirB N-terminal domain-containing protein [Solwaraspora sp. WMMD406]|uniref:sirohydrochlorin chelatase n=1 Tax=Solwaraspora sp. WMMD406 TaxID=3016095 RepID=UPI0024165F0A|nr:CbiX/SirB N-terminal domain-containing protein [Solwaraspora sp. WMMD406]MDG4767629.1 CbiX/SirB N-terminal domain-containing protein [Solwaraspora sp. WMMD406]
MRPALVTGPLTPVPNPIVLVAHGSRDPQAAAATRALVRSVAAARPGTDVRAAYLDHAGPRPGRVLADLQAAGYPRVSLVPLLLTEAFHGRVDIPQTVADARADGLRIPVTITEVLGPPVGTTAVDPLLIAGLSRRLAQAGSGFDAVVLAAAGTRSAPARQTVAATAAAFGATLGVPCAVGYASAAPPTAGAAVEALRRAGARRVAVAAYFLAPGLLYETAVSSAREAGAVWAAAPLAGSVDIARLVLSRVDRAGALVSA